MLDQRKQCRVLIIEPVATIRQMITDTLKDLGYVHVQAIPKAKDALHYMEVEPVDWVVMPSLINDEINCIQMLQVVVNEVRMRHVRISLFIEADTERKLLSLAFELGLFSWHHRAYIKDSLAEEFENLFSIYNLRGRSDILTSADYLRKYLNEERKYQHRLVFDQNLIELYPGSSQCLLSLAESYFLNERTNDGLRTLKQVELISPKMKPLCESMRRKFPHDETSQPDDGSAKNCLGVRSCLIIDPDTDNLHAIRADLERLGVRDVECFEDGQQAFFNMSMNKEPGLIIMEWKIPGLTGPLLIQRIRWFGYVNVPIVVTSSQVDKNDIPLIKEVGVDAVLAKPFEASDFYATLIWALQQNRKPSEQKSFDLKIRRLLQGGKLVEAERMIYQYNEDPRFSVLDKMSIKAEYMYLRDETGKCKKYCTAVLRQDPDRFQVLNLLGRLYLKQGDFDKALKCMEKAQKLAPQNIERILNIADIHFELGQVEQSQQALNQAMDLDPGSEAVKGLQAQIAIETGDLDEAGEIMNDLTVIDNVVRDMNNRAVAYAKNGRYTDSIRLYQDTLRVIPRREGQIKRSVQYNLCLSYVKYGELENALSVIRDLDTDGKTPIELKIASLRTKIQRTLKEGFTLKVDLETHAHAPDDTSQSVQDEEDAEDIDNDELLANESSIARDANMSLLEATRGDICCHLIYFDIQGISPDVDRLRQTLPHFRPRQSLQKTV